MPEHSRDARILNGRSGSGPQKSEGPTPGPARNTKKFPRSGPARSRRPARRPVTRVTVAITHRTLASARNVGARSPAALKPAAMAPRGLRDSLSRVWRCPPGPSPRLSPSGYVLPRTDCAQTRSTRTGPRPEGGPESELEEPGATKERWKSRHTQCGNRAPCSTPTDAGCVAQHSSDVDVARTGDLGYVCHRQVGDLCPRSHKGGMTWQRQWRMSTARVATANDTGVRILDLVAHRRRLRRRLRGRPIGRATIRRCRGGTVATAVAADV